VTREANLTFRTQIYLRLFVSKVMTLYPHTILEVSIRLSDFDLIASKRRRKGRGGEKLNPAPGGGGVLQDFCNKCQFIFPLGDIMYYGAFWLAARSWDHFITRLSPVYKPFTTLLPPTLCIDETRRHVTCDVCVLALCVVGRQNMRWIVAKTRDSVVHSVRNYGFVFIETR